MKHPKSKNMFAAALVLALAFCLHAAENRLDEGFQGVPASDRPWAYWWWLNGNVDEHTITRDLEGMKQQGFGGLLMFDARGYHDDPNHVIMPPSRMDFMSPEWRRMLKHALREAHRLGLEMSVNLSSCAGALKGPWEVGNDAPKQLAWTATAVPGPQALECMLERPKDKRFWDVALLAVRHDEPALNSAAAPSRVSDDWQAVASKLGAKPAVVEVVDLSRKVDGQGRFKWNVPAGHWTLLRFGCLTMEGHEYDVDVLDAKAVEGHFGRMGQALLKDAGPLAGPGRTLTHFYSVSWEGAAPTWTLGLEKEFKQYRGYELRPWLPVLAGLVVSDRERSERFLRDYYKTLGECFMNNFYGTLQRLCQRAGLKWHSESGGPWNRKLASFAEADQLAFLGRNDLPQGEFWFAPHPSKRRQELNRPPAMAAHIYGKRLAAAEAFTHMAQHWSAHPAALKPFADAAFCDGVNHFIWHTFTCSPIEFGKPGSEYFAGTHINPNVTWFPQAGPFVDYLARCQFLLRQGGFVADVCAYVGDKPYQHWGRGTNWSDRSTVQLPRGHTYDLINTEVLLSRLKVKQGNLVLPDGMTYRLLVVDLDEETVPPAALRKITQLQKAGATVVFGQRKPQRAPGLSHFPACDDEVRRLAAGLWKQPMALEAALRTKNLLPDFEGPAEYTHRRVNGTDIYFVSGQGRFDCTFRVSGKQPELWDAVHGKMADAPNWRTRPDGRTLVSLALPANGSTFVVFRKPCQTSPRQSPAPATPEEKPLTGPWTVSFEPGRGAPEKVVFGQLSAWNEHPQDGIKFFSGKATYRASFDLASDEANHRARLQLGEVKCLAHVRLNGHDLGVVWTDPWSIELTGAVRSGRNELEIDVVNTWVNRLIGDAGQPRDQRVTQSNLALQQGPRTIKPHQGFASEDPLMRSGLMGPVRLELFR